MSRDRGRDPSDVIPPVIRQPGWNAPSYKEAESPAFSPWWKMGSTAAVILEEMSVGSVIRWIAAARFTYVAVKTPIGWYTSAPEGNVHVDQVMQTHELGNLLYDKEFAIALHWEVVNVPPF